MSVFRKILAILLLPCLAVLLTATLLAATLDATLLRSPFLKYQLRKVSAYDVALAELDRQLSTQLSGQLGELGSDGPLNSNDLFSIIRGVTTASWLETEVERNLDTLDAWLNRGKTLTIALRIRDRKPLILNEFDAWLERKFSELPRCTERNPSSLENLCIPPGMTADELHGFLRENGLDAESIVGSLPDEIDLLQPHASLKPFFEKLGLSSGDERGPDFAERLEEVRGTVDDARRILLLVEIALAALVVIELLLMAQGKRALARWVGTMLVVTAAPPLLVGAIGYLGSATFIVGQLQLQGVRPETQAAITSLAKNVLAAISTPLFVYGGTAIVLGVILRLASKFLKEQSPLRVRHRK